MWYASTLNTCVLCLDGAVENWRYTSVLKFMLANSSPLCAFPTPPQFFQRNRVHTRLRTPRPRRPWTAYARGCGAEAAARVGAWASLGCTQCKAAGDWPSSEGKGTLLSQLRRLRQCAGDVGQRSWTELDSMHSNRGWVTSETPARSLRRVYHVTLPSKPPSPKEMTTLSFCTHSYDAPC